MIKNETVKIMQFQAVADKTWPNDTIIYGLGDDGNVYVWDTRTGKWNLYVNSAPGCHETGPK